MPSMSKCLTAPRTSSDITSHGAKQIDSRILPCKRGRRSCAIITRVGPHAFCLSLVSRLYSGKTINLPKGSVHLAQYSLLETLLLREMVELV